MAKMEVRPIRMYPISYRESGLPGTSSLTYRYMLDVICVIKITNDCKKIARGIPSLYIEFGKPTIPPPTHVLKIASPPLKAVRPCSPAITENLDLRYGLFLEWCISSSKDFKNVAQSPWFTELCELKVPLRLFSSSLAVNSSSFPSKFLLSSLLSVSVILFKHRIVCNFIQSES